MSHLKKVNAAIVGYGNIGRFVREAIEASGDFTLAGVVSSSNRVIDGVKVVADIGELSNVDVAILTAPSRAVPDMAAKFLARGISCVDSYDIHSDILEYKKSVEGIAKLNDAVCVLSAGWDPGTDSVVRALMLAMAPKGVSYTDFGPGMSMGHSVCVRGKDGVKDALSMTMPKGEGIHRRMVYIELEDGADLETVTKSIKTDPYFAKDETHVIPVPSVAALCDMGHGVTICRKGVSGQTHNQLLSFDMRINNPALTAQVLVSAARAATRIAPGAYTMIEIPMIDLLEGDRDQLIHDLV